MSTQTAGETFEDVKSAADNVIETAKDAEGKVLDAVDSAQEAIGKATPVTTKFDVTASPSDIKSRLDWGEPALTILDVRDRESFNDERIMGAMSMPMDDLVDMAKQSLFSERDIYVYGSSDSETSSAATKLRDAGFSKVSALQGGLSAWKAINGAVEGRGQAPGLLEKGGASLINQNATP